MSDEEPSGEAELAFTDFAIIPLRLGEPMLIDLAGPHYKGYGHTHTIMALLAELKQDK